MNNKTLFCAVGIDEGRLIATDKGTVIDIEEVLAEDNGCDIPAPIK